MTVNILFVCLGNICRSPTAHGLFEHTVKQAGLAKKIIVDSAGTGGWHSGSAPDERAQEAALERGYDISQLRARKVSVDDFAEFDYVLAMDNDNLKQLSALKPDGYQGTLGLFLEVAGVSADTQEVPDPYYGGHEHFKRVIQLVEDGAHGLLARIKQEHGL